MAKTNFTKVEEILDENLRKMTADHLLNQTKKTDKPNSHKKLLTEVQKQLISSLKRHLTGILRKESEAYNKMDVNKSELTRLINHPEDLSPQEWEALNQIHKKIAAFKEELRHKLPTIDNESLVEAQRKKHVNKRFNTNDKWLPLQ
jgi:hypothetical protein